MLGHPLRDRVSWLFPSLFLLTGWDSLLPTAPWFVGFWVGSAEGDTDRGVVRNRGGLLPSFLALPGLW